MRSQIILAETIGTFALVFFGCGAIIVNDIMDGRIGAGGIALVFGGIVMVMIYSVGNISGAHLNPAVSLGFVLAGRQKWSSLLIYIPSQIVRASLAILILKAGFQNHSDLGATQISIPPIPALITEIILTFMLMFIILNVSTGYYEKGIMAGIAIGSFVAISAFIAGPLTGASMNPVRSLIPMVVSNQLSNWWLYLIGPFVGAAMAAPFCKWVQRDKCSSLEST